MQIIALLMLTSSAFAFGGKKPAPTPSPTPIPQHQSECGEIRYFPDSSYTKLEADKLQEAEHIVNYLIGSECFEDFFLNAKRLENTGGRTAAEVVDHIRSLCLKIPVTMYYKKNNIVGYRNPPSLRIYTNRYIHQNYTSCDVASNVGHEALHGAGYAHDFERTEQRPYSVNYTWNKMTRACCPVGETQYAQYLKQFNK